MKKLLMTCLLAFGLGGCATTGGTNPDISAEIQKAQQIAVQVCGFLPAVETVSGILTTFIPGGAPANAIASQVANAICAAVTNKSVSLTGPMVNGVPVKGEWVKKSYRVKKVSSVNGIPINGVFVR